MRQSDYLELSSKRDVKKNVVSESNEQAKSVDFVVSECRKFLNLNAHEYSNKEGDEKKSTLQNLINKFIENINYKVEGFITPDGKLNVNDLVSKLSQDITDYGILSSAIYDDDVSEIQINGKEIKVERKGHIEDYRDKADKIISFDSPTQQEVVFRRLLGDVRLSPKDTLANARTVEGYRIAAVHHSAIAMDTLVQSNNGYNYAVIRKFKKNKMPIQQLVKFKTLSDNMAKFLGTMIEGGSTFLTVGPTASGKTTTNQSILDTTPNDLRTLLIQNPSEIDLARRDGTGRVINNVIHLEARSIENPTESDPTMENFMNQALRLSPTFISFGELRSDGEFARAMTAALAGHSFNCTFHAEDSYGAMMRYATAYSAGSGSDRETVIINLTGVVNFIIVQKIMRDGTRKILQITEVLGTKKDDKSEPELNDLYIYDVGETIYDENKNIVSITGTHKRVGKLSDASVKKFKLNGVDPDKYSFLLDDPNDYEVETYTGDFKFKL